MFDDASDDFPGCTETMLGRRKGQRIGSYHKTRTTPAGKAIEKCKRDLNCTFDELADLLNKAGVRVSRRTLITIVNSEEKYAGYNKRNEVERGLKAIWKNKFPKLSLPQEFFFT